MTRIRVSSHIFVLLSVLLTYGDSFSQVNTSSSQQLAHPLDPLTAEEIEQTVTILQADARFGPETRFAIIDLHEPSKAQVRQDVETGVFRRAARALFYNWASSVGSDAVVDLNAQTLVSWQDLDSERPPIRRLVISRLNEVVKRDERWKEALSKFGIADDSRINMLASMPEDMPIQSQDGDLIVRSRPFMMDERPESYSLPVSMSVNLTKGEVLTLETPEGASWTTSDRTPPDWGRAPRTPLEITQPEGTSFQINGSKVTWRNWTFHFGVHPRRGLELFDIKYRDQGEDRSILYRAAVSETLTPYGDPEWSVWYPIDEGDYGHWFAIEEKVLMTELTARRSVNPALNRSWRILNRDRVNTLGDNTAYALMPKGNAFPAAAPGAPSRKKMGFVDHHLWVTPFQPEEIYAGGTYLEAGVRGGGLPEWTAEDRSVDNTDLVVWYVVGLTHQVRPEDFPLMPVHTAGLSLWPFGFFSINPSMDVVSQENE